MYKPLYEDWTKENYENSNIRYVEPMTAHALETEEEQDEKLSDPNCIIEEKFDGTRATLHFMSTGVRVFSRRISKKTGWFVENTDSLPQMRSLNIPQLEGTVIDGEMFIPNRPFKDVSATLNCKWDKAIERQKELGDIVFHTFDIMYYKGIKVENFSLKRRKKFLSIVTKVLKSYGVECIVEVPYMSCGNVQEMRDYYNKIVQRGGEGVMVKDLSMKYEHKRSKAYLKIKKFYTRECVLLSFNEPTKYYDGKFPDDSWEYWETPEGKSCILIDSAKSLVSRGYKPLTKFYYNNWVGNMIFGVLITDEEVQSLPKGKTFDFAYLDDRRFLIVGECSGFDDDLRCKLNDKYIGKVIEVKCNEIFKDTGKLRHPRFLRFRPDKDLEECTYENHITE